MDTQKKQFKIKPFIRNAWSDFKKGWTFLVPAFIASSLVLVLLQWLSTQVNGIASLVIIIAGWVAQAIFILGWTTIYLKTTRNELTDWGDFAEHSNIWWKIFLGNILYGLLIQIGFLLLIIPGFYFMLKYQYFMFVLVEHPEYGIWQSFKESARITKGARWKLLAFWFVSLGLVILGLIALGVGIIVSVLIIGIANAYIYRSLVDQTADKVVSAEAVE